MRKMLQPALVSTGIVATLALLLPLRGRPLPAQAAAPDESWQTLPVGPLLGKQVFMLLTPSGTQDNQTGTLEAADSSWVRLRTKTGKVVCFPVSRVYFVTRAGDETKP
jgi:hypothetical protein